MRTFGQKYIGDKYFSRIFNNLAVLVFYSKLQLIQNFLTNDLVPPSPRSPTNLDWVGRAAVCQCQKKFETNCSDRRDLSTDIKQFNQNIRIPHS
jgi:hypothetical protein